MPKRNFFVVIIIAFIILIVFNLAGLALSLDQQPVVDDARIFGTRIGEVEDAAGKLVGQGADIRVRTILTYGTAGNLDQFEAQLEQQSSSWQDQNGNRKNNLIVLIISLQERQTGLYYGSIWESTLVNNWLKIQTDIMNPLFRDGDYVGGTVQGLAEIQRLIKNQGQSPAVVQKATASTKWWIIPVSVIVIVGLLLGLVLFFYYRKIQARRTAIRQKAMLAKQAAASGINELIQTTQMLEIKVNVTADKVVAEDAAVLRDGLETAKRLTNQSSQTYSELSHSAGDPENPKLGEVQLGVIEPEYQKILVNLRQAKEAVSGVENNIAVIQQYLSDFPNQVSQVNSAIEDNLKKQAELNKAGFKTSYLAGLVAKARDTLEKAQSLVAEKRLAEGTKQVTMANDQMKQANQAVADLPQKKQEAESSLQQLNSRIEKVKESIVKGRVIFERLLQSYAETNWESVRGNGTEAENRVNWSQEAYNDAVTAAGLAQQDWYQSLDLVKKANDWLTEAESLMKAISDLEVNLLAAKRDAPAEISAAQTDISAAWDYIKRYDEDIRESLEDDLHSAENKNNLAKEELTKPQPDYFKVSKAALEAHENADKILVQARSEHELAERLRVKAASSLRDASAKISIAGTYIENHHPVVQQEARSYFTNAVEALKQAQSASDVNVQISSANSAESAADQAYSLASRDVSRTNMNIPQFGLPNVNTPNVIIPPMIFPPGGSRMGGPPSWGSSRPSGSNSGNTFRPGGGGSSGWNSKAGGSSAGSSGKGGGSSGW